MGTPDDHDVAERHQRLEVLERGTTLEAALAFYDGLPPVTVGEMLGVWHGSGMATGNPLDGLLETVGWHGKRFDSPEAAHPLVFATPGGGRTSISPARIPLGLVTRFARILRHPVWGRVFGVVRPLLTTTRPHARLRMTEHRGVVTGTMVYDALPIHDVFRKVDDDTMLGAMDLRGMADPFMFVLRREPAPGRPPSHGSRT